MRKMLTLTLSLFLLLSLSIFLPTITYANHTSKPTAEFSYNTGTGHSACAGVTFENPHTAECDALMANRPTPNVTPLATNMGIISEDVFLRFNTNNVPVYDAPNGNFIETIITGYTYVAPRQFRDGWAEIRAGRWVETRYTRTGSPSTFAGVTIGNLDMPFAWILWRHYGRISPAGETDYENGYVTRYQVVNIYATVNVRGWNWHLIGPNLWTNQQNLSIVNPGTPASFGGNWAAVNLYEQNLVAYSGATPVMASLVSSGLKNGKWDTPEGTYQVGVRVEAGIMSGAEGAADYYSLDKVPYAQYFNGLISLHGTYWHDSFGYPHSHGCVNLTVSDANWLFSFLGEGSTIYVY